MAVSTLRWGVLTTSRAPDMTSQSSPRAAAVLDAVVETYITSGLPVGSATVADRVTEPVSSATIRNVMAELERQGYLEQPHTSAGRVPTSRGYARYVKSLMREGRLQSVDETPIKRRLHDAPQEVDSLLHQVCSTLSEMTSLVGVVLTPPAADTDIRHVELVRLGHKRVLVVFVGGGGAVHTRAITLEEELDDAELDEAASYLAQRFIGRTLRQARERIRAASEERQPRARAMAVLLARRSLSRRIEESEVLVEGAFHLLDRPEMAGGPMLPGIFAAFEERRLLGSVLTECGSSFGPSVLIGRERLPRAFEDCALIAASFRSGSQSVGALGVMGPTRMEYNRTIPMVAAMARATSEVLSELHR